MQKFTKNGRIVKPKPKKSDLVTKGMMDGFFQNLADFVKSTVRATETHLVKRIDRVEAELQRTQVALKTVKDDLTEKIDSVDKKLTGEMKAMEIRLTEKIDGIGTKVEDHEVRIGALERVA